MFVATSYPLPSVEKRNFLLYALAVLLFICLHMAFKRADVEDVRFLLAPADKVLEWATGSRAEWSAEGYFHPELNIIVGKACAGAYFGTICFLMLTFLSLRFLNRWQHKLLAIPAVLLGTYLLTLLANTSRLLFSVFLHEKLVLLAGKNLSWLHQAEGSLVYLFSLIVIYLGFDFLFTQLRENHAKVS
ncbi:MAG: exosortase K [Bacteroidetes bacterium]|nr:MAG: exosortase K [Bacteroidota bacterium]